MHHTFQPSDALDYVSIVQTYPVENMHEKVVYRIYCRLFAAFNFSQMAVNNDVIRITNHITFHKHARTLNHFKTSLSVVHRGVHTCKHNTQAQYTSSKLKQQLL